MKIHLKYSIFFVVNRLARRDSGDLTRRPSGQWTDSGIHSGRTWARYHELTDPLDSFQRESCDTATEEVIGQRTWNDLRLVIVHDSMTAADQTAKRNARIKALIAQGDQ